jgi:hypothetical protein
MIRPFTFITMLLAALSGAYLFAVKHRAQVLDDQLAAVAQSSRLDGQRIRVLQAQWALETDPTRLGALAVQFTNLQPMKPAQLITLASLQEALPPPGSPAPGANPLDTAPAMPLAQAADQPVAQAGSSLPLPPALPPVVLASAAAPAAAIPAAVHNPHPVSHSALHMAATNFAASLPPPRAYHAPSQPPAQSLAQTAIRSVPMGAQIMSVKAVSTPMNQAPMTETAAGSALSMGSDLPPPQPLPAAGAEN